LKPAALADRAAASPKVLGAFAEGADGFAEGADDFAERAVFFAEGAKALMLADFLHSIRWLRQTPALAIAAVTTLAVAIGTAVAVFAVADRVLIRPLPIQDAGRIFIVWPRERANPATIGEVSYATFRKWQDDATGLQQLAAIGSVNWSLVLREGEPATIPVAAVSSSFFPLLAAPPHLGRTILPQDDERGATKVAVLSYRSWVRRFGADAGIVGRQLRFGDGAYTIVGVMPEGFAYPPGAELWVPLVPQLEAASREWGTDVIGEPGFGVLFLMGRLDRGISVESARRRVSDLITRDEGVAFRPDMEAVLTPLDEHLFGKAKPALLGLALCAGLVLLIASANVAVLLLVRAATRADEAATRIALGASRWRIIRQSVADALSISAAGAVLGLVLAYWAVRGLVALVPVDIPRLESVHFDGRTFGFAVVVCLTAAMLIGVAPGLQASRQRLALDTRTRGGMTRSHRLRRVFVAVQVGLAFVLLVCAGLVGRSFLNLLRIDLGFNPSRVLTLDVKLNDVPVPRHTSFYELLLERVRALPDVEAAAAVLQRPLEHAGIGMDGTILIEGQRTELQFRDWQQNPRVNLESVTSGYFAAMGTTILQGRDFSVADTLEAPRVAIVGERLADRLWPGQNPIGKRITAPGTLPDAKGDRDVWVAVVGVVRDVRYRGLTDPRFDLYLPHAQSDLRVQHLMVRSSAAPALLAGAIRAEARRLEPAVLVENIETMGELVRAATAPWRFSVSTLTMLGVLALALALVGVYATVSQSVVERTHEIGIRVAVGAMPQHIRQLIFREGLGLACAGVVIGIGLAVVLVRIVSGLLVGVQQVDVATLTVTAVALLTTSALALWIPAWRAARVEPAVALRRL